MVAHVRVGSRIPLWVAGGLAVAVLVVACGTEPLPPPDPVRWDLVQNSSVPADAIGEEHVTLNAGRYSALTGDVADAIEVSLHELHATGDLDGNRVDDEVGLMISTAGEQLRTESIVGFLAAAGGPVATAPYPLPTSYRVEALSVGTDGVVVTYAAPRLKGTAYDEISGHLVLRLEDNGFNEVDRSEEAVSLPSPEPLGVAAGKDAERTG